MANFHTHLSIALAVSTSVATAGLMLGLFGFFEMVVLALIGMIGGLLPDIDLDSSKISHIAFTLASLFGASFLVFLWFNYRPPAAPTPKIADLMVLWGILVLLLRFGVFWLFSRLTRHRGMVHSVPYMAVLSLLFVLLCYHFLALPAKLCWLFGFFLFIGSLVHLILDELYSVNVYGLKMKKSKGTALKFFERKRPVAYLILYGLVLGLWYFAPSHLELIKLFLPILARI